MGEEHLARKGAAFTVGQGGKKTEIKAKIIKPKITSLQITGRKQAVLALFHGQLGSSKGEMH